MKAKRHKIAPIILKLLEKIPKGKAMMMIETKDFKAPSVNRFIKRRHKKGELQEYKFMQRKINNHLAIFIARKSVTFPFSYIR